MNPTIGIALLLAGTGQGAGLAFQASGFLPFREIASWSQPQKCRWLKGLKLPDLSVCGSLGKLETTWELRLPLDLLSLKHTDGAQLKETRD